MKIKKYLIIAVVLITIGLLGLSISGVVAKYKYGLYPGFNCGSSPSLGFGHMSQMVAAMDMMGSSWLLAEGESLESYSFKEVKERIESYLEKNNLEGLKIVEIMEFSNNFYIEISEKDSDMGAMELLLDKSTGNIFPEYGPNMMWNKKYGMHVGTGKADMAIGEEEAIQLAEKYLDSRSTGELVGEEASRYYGYYTIHTVAKDGDILGMLSINGDTGKVWYHSWHGTFIGMEEYEVH